MTRGLVILLLFCCRERVMSSLFSLRVLHALTPVMCGLPKTEGFITQPVSGCPWAIKVDRALQVADGAAL
jgi:hypothetical protein